MKTLQVFLFEKNTKSLKIFYLLRNVDFSKLFAKFLRFDNNITKSIFFHSNSLIKTKNNCQKLVRKSRTH